MSKNVTPAIFFIVCQALKVCTIKEIKYLLGQRSVCDCSLGNSATFSGWGVLRICSACRLSCGSYGFCNVECDTKSKRQEQGLTHRTPRIKSSVRRGRFQEEWITSWHLWLRLLFYSLKKYLTGLDFLYDRNDKKCK